MIQQDKLFALIQSLTPHEKAYFAKYSRLNAAKEKPDYLLLFEFLDSAETYNEAALKKHFKHEKFISQLARKKTQLKDKIMECLSHYHANRTVESSLRLQMNVLPILYDKAAKDKTLVKEFENQIKAIKKKAEKEECFAILVDLFRWERQLIKLQDDNKHDDKVLLLIESYEASQDSLNKEQVLEAAVIRTELILVKDPKVKNAKNREQYKNSISPLIDIESDKLSKKAKRYYYYIKSSHYSYLDDWESAHCAVENLINTYSEVDIANPIILKEYKKHLCRYLVVSSYSRKFDNYLNVINKIEATSSNDDDIRLFNTIHFKTLNYYLGKLQFKEAIGVAQKIEKRWDELSNIIPRRRQLSYSYNIMIAYWLGKELNTAIYWLSIIFNFEHVPQGQRYVTLARIIQLPIYYDAEYEHIENRIESARKMLAKKKELNKYRQVILAGFRKLIRCINEQDKKNCIMDMYDKLLLIKTSQRIRAAELECILLWCQSKVEKQTNLTDVNK